MKFKKFGPCYLMADGADGLLGGGGVGGSDDTGAGGNEFNFEEFKSTYGKDYADKGFMQELDSPTKMFEKIDNLETLIGKKSFVPGENATPEDWNNYRNKIGVTSPDVYTISDADLPENIKSFHDENINNKVKQIFYDAGLTPEQGKIVSEKYNKMMIEAHGEMLNNVAAREKELQISDAEFEEMANKTWGAERENIQNTAKALISKYTPEHLKLHVQNMSNKDLIIMASVLNGVSKDYISEDDLSKLRGGVGSSNLNAREEAQKELAKLASMSKFDPGYEKQQEKVNSMYSSLTFDTSKK